MPTPETGSYTFLFTDIEGSTRLWERDPEAMKTALTVHDGILRRAIDAHHGRVFKTMGDAFYAVFTSARDAVEAALEAQRDLQAHPWAGIGSLHVRAALHTGPADERDGDYFGSTLNRVARILAVGYGGQTLVSQAVHALVADSLPPDVGLRDLGAHRLRDLHRPEHIFMVLAPGLPVDFPPLRSLDALPNNLPRQLTSFIGRDRELAELKQLLGQTRLLTIVGTGGAGKTRLALQAAAEMLEEMTDGVWLAELAPVLDPAVVPQAVGAALGVRPEANRPMIDTLIEYLEPKQTLLILDNCEHLVDACAALVDELLQGCPRLRILCTSREALGVTGETAWRIPSLSLPNLHALPPIERLSEYEAIRLFVERAAAVAPGFTLTAEQAAAVAAICARLDGIPLAIELAAARVKVLTPPQIAARLDDRFRLLTGGSRTALPRHQTLRAAMDWSYELLSSTERAMLRRFSVFANGWTLEAAEAICIGPDIERGDVLDLQAALIDKSLVVVEEAGADARYRLLETVRQYARDKLVEAGEAEAWRTRHRDWFLALAEEARQRLQGREQTMWLGRLAGEHENLHAALEWSLACRDAEALLRFVAAIWWYWYVRGHLEEGNRWAQIALEQTAERTPGRARALAGAAALAHAAGQYARAQAHGEEGRALAADLGDTLSQAIATVALSLVALARGDQTRAVALAEDARGRLPALENKWGRAIVGLLIGEIARLRGDWAETLARLHESHAQFRDVGDLWGMALAQRGLGFIARAEGDYERAAVLHEEGRSFARQIGDKVGEAYALLSLAIGEMRRGFYAEAEARMLEALPLMRDAGDKSGIANILYYMGLAISFQGRNDEAERLMTESREIAVSTGARAVAAYATSGLARVAMHRGDSARTTALALEAQKGFKDAGDRWGVAVTLYLLGVAALRDRAYERARALGEESLKQFLAMRDGWAAGSARRLAARGALGMGEYGRAEDLYAESLRRAAGRGERLGVARGLQGLAMVAARTDRLQRAATLLGADEALRATMGVPVPESEREEYGRLLDTVRAGLGTEVFDAAWAEGQRLGWERATEYALAAEHTARRGAGDSARAGAESRIPEGA
ncbi:MAG: adenylate/guanylate cyclase domain-containing protein [Armatimonadota bacterium]|nr:adenylate/guanylate cyclase domain-containing protein [Armatimonadota bacterium]